jgi:hypothetical protein
MEELLNKKKTTMKWSLRAIKWHISALPNCINLY